MFAFPWAYSPLIFSQIYVIEVFPPFLFIFPPIFIHLPPFPKALCPKTSCWMGCKLWSCRQLIAGFSWSFLPSKVPIRSRRKKISFIFYNYTSLQHNFYQLSFILHLCNKKSLISIVCESCQAGEVIKTETSIPAGIPAIVRMKQSMVFELLQSN